METKFAPHVPDADVAEIRAFNRFFTRRIGVLRPGLLDSPWSLTEVRILYELLHRDRTEAVDLRRTLDMDAGQLSRVLTRMESNGLISRAPSPDDGRRQVIELSPAGARAATLLDQRSSSQIRELIGHLSAGDRRRLSEAMATVRRLVSDPDVDHGEPVLRPLAPGDLGWVVERNGALYAEEYGWDHTYEALVARIAAEYGAEHDPATENAWIAELAGERVGCVFCVRADPPDSPTVHTAKLRLLLVEPSARGHGIGRLLVDECVSFARATGYQRVTLWTNDCLTAARRLYRRAGFGLVASEPHHSFGHDLVGETWEMDLSPGPLP